MAQEPPPDWFWKIEPHRGEWYLKSLERLHAALKPRRYLELGSRSGDSLRLARCASIAVDPEFGPLAGNIVGAKPGLMLFQTTSDRFFADHDPSALLGGPIDLAFLDGMHLYEFLLRDFINTERHCRPNSVIVLHDCLPLDPYVARRKPDDLSLARYTDAPGDWWAGDVWKTVALLQRYRPELSIHAYAAPPTGLVTVTNLDPASTLLASRYAEAVASIRDAGAAEFHAYRTALSTDPTDFLASFENIAERYWL